MPISIGNINQIILLEGRVLLTKDLQDNIALITKTQPVRNKATIFNGLRTANLAEM